MAIPTQLSQFKRLSSNVLISSSPEASTRGPANAPDLIIIAAWMGAALKHVAKYVTPYVNIYPSSQIIIITNDPSDIILRSYSDQQKRLLPVVDAIRSVADATTKPKILLHSFSNGGNIQVVQLAIAYREKFHEHLPLTTVLIDSAPGRSTYSRAVVAFKPALPRNPVLWWLGLGALHTFLTSVLVYRYVFGQADVLDWMREKINDTELLPSSAPRTYIYSETDELVGYQDVEEHAAESKKLGFTVNLVKFDKSRHVAHAIADGDKYWSTVQQAWKDGLAVS